MLANSWREWGGLRRGLFGCLPGNRAVLADAVLRWPVCSSHRALAVLPSGNATAGRFLGIARAGIGQSVFPGRDCSGASVARFVGRRRGGMDCSRPSELNPQTHHGPDQLDRQSAESRVRSRARVAAGSRIRWGEETAGPYPPPLIGRTVGFRSAPGLVTCSRTVELSLNPGS